MEEHGGQERNLVVVAEVWMPRMTSTGHGGDLKAGTLTEVLAEGGRMVEERDLAEEGGIGQEGEDSSRRGAS